MVTASDVITYIGVPLAVVGVMPVMYTCSSAIVTQYKVLKAVKKNDQEVATRMGLLSGVVEVDFPRYTIHPLPRHDALYWKHTSNPSVLKGGSWTVFQWQRVTTGKATYRIQHSDELRQPQAEILLSDLVTFLLDRGATPHAHGLQLLRIMGLQTPPGTALLMCGNRPVLAVAVPDESEGHLSLRLHWTDDLRVRSSDCLPPYWVRLYSRKIHGEEAKYPPVRLYLGTDGLEHAQLEEIVTTKEKQEEKQKEMEEEGSSLDLDMEDGTIDHLRPDSRYPGTASLWFACATVAICGKHQGGLFRFTIPSRILQFCRRDTIPHGVLVLLGMRDETETPLGAERARLRQDTARQRQYHDLAEQGRRATQMMTMAPAERAKALGEDGMARLRKMDEDRRQRQLEELDRKAEALNSPRVANRVVAEAAFGWLKDHKHLRLPDQPTDETTLHQIGLSILHSMVFDAKFASSVVRLLDGWIGWVDSVMNDAHWEAFRDDQVHFCYAAILAHQIAEYTVDGKVLPVARDLDECQRVWRSVYLG